MTGETNDAMLKALATRRSVKADLLTAPGPSATQLNAILTIAARVPDHKKLAPWRFMIIEGQAREQAGEFAAIACQQEEKDPPSPVRLEMERGRFLRAPLVVAVISSPVRRPGAPEWEQVLSAGAAAMNLCHAANAMGFATHWLTEWIAYSPYMRSSFGLSETERIVGFIHIGTATEKPDDRERPDLVSIVSRWNGSA